MKTLAVSVSLALALLGCRGGATPPDEEPASTIPERGTTSDMLGGCILKNPIGEVPDDLYQVSDVVPARNIPPFTKRLTVYGLTLAARDDASDDFMRLVAKTVTEIFPRREGLDLAKQEEILRNQYLHKALIPIPVGHDMSFMHDKAEWMKTAGSNSVCDIIMEGVPSQVMEVVEHILHYVSDTGLHYAFPNEWGISESSELATAMNEAIDKGYYDIEQYGNEPEEEHFRILMQEFAYWAISTYWDLQEAYGPDAEWHIVRAAELKEKLPDLYDMLDRTVATVMAPPSIATLQEIGPTTREERAAVNP